MIRYETVKIIHMNDWDKLVTDIYKKPYKFQQQYGCQGRGLFHLTIPTDETYGDEINEEIPEIVNHETMCVTLDKWLERDPSQPLKNDDSLLSLELWWERNFYPDIYTVANDLCEKGFIEPGDYAIKIDW